MKATIPTKILQIEDLTPHEKLVWGVVFDLYMSLDSPVSLTNEEISKAVCIHQGSVTRILLNLERCGLLKRMDKTSANRRLVPSLKYQPQKPTQRPSETISSEPEPNTQQKAEPTPVRSEVREIFDYWRDNRPTLVGPSPELDMRTRYLVTDRLKEGFSVDDIKKAINGCFNSDFYVEHGLTELTYICKNRSTLQRFLQTTHYKKKNKEETATSRYQRWDD